MIKKVILAAFLASIVGIVILYLVGDLLGNQVLLKTCYQANEQILRHANLLSKSPSRILKYFCAFLLSNALWAYIYSVRQKAFTGSSVEKGIKFFLLLWLLTVPVHFWSWIFIAYSKKILLYNVFVYQLLLYLGTGAVIGKICSEK